ncbi:MAG: hypothetical protein JZU50_08360 [Desulfobulbaceae bacterium]|nr:hypothetical protein [Desulfobulbaceae bacterium]
MDDQQRKQIIQAVAAGVTLIRAAELAGVPLNEILKEAGKNGGKLKLRSRFKVTLKGAQAKSFLKEHKGEVEQ